MNRFRAALATVTIVAAGFLGCSDQPVGPAAGNIHVDVRASIVIASPPTLPINRIVLTARAVNSGALLGSLDRLVDPTATQWTLPLELSIGSGAATEVAIAMELMHVEGTTVSVEYSGTTFVTLVAGEQKAIADVQLHPGALAPIAAVEISPGQAAIKTGGSTALTGIARDAQGNVLARTFTWTSADTSIASVSSTGLVTGKRTGTVLVTGRTENKSASSSITVYTPSATRIIRLSGNAQSANVSTAVPNPMRVQVVDQEGSPVAGQAVQWVVTAGGGVITPASSATDVSGSTEARYTAGTTVGTATIEARATGLTGSPVVFSVTVIPQAPVNTITLAPATRTLAGGDTVRLTPTALDAAGNPLTGVLYTWSSSDTIVARVSGSGLVTALGRGTATIRATSNGKTGTATITVVTGAARSIGSFSGNNQTAHTGTRLSSDILVRVVDAGGNGVSGVDVVFTVLSGGGTVTQRTVKTDTTGIAATGWTLGNVLGTQSLEAASAGLTGSPLLFTATGTGDIGIRRTWIGGDAAAPDIWSIGNNWSPAGVPSNQDTAVIAPASRQPVLNQNVVVGAVIVQANATVNNSGYDLTALRMFDVTGNAVGIGSFTLSGGATFVRGNFSNLYIRSRAVATNAISATGVVVIPDSASLTLSGFRLTVAEDLSVFGGTLIMNNANDVVVTRNIAFGNTNENGKLLAGLIRVSGNFITACYNDTEFTPNGTRVVMNGTAPQQIQMCSTPTGNRFGDLTISAGANVSTSDVIYIDTFTISGTMTVNATGIVDTRVLTVTAGGVLNNNGITRTNLPFVNNGTLTGRPVVQR